MPILNKRLTVGIAQLVRAQVCGTWGRGFESHYPPFKARILRAFFVLKGFCLDFQGSYGKICKTAVLDRKSVFLRTEQDYDSSNNRRNCIGKRG